MRWQDIVIAVAQVCFVFAMLPSIVSKDKPALATSVMNIVLVLTITFCLLTLRLWLSAITACAIAATWSVLAIQKYQLNNKKARH
jgi:heme O synthase-like polyprenyltransferase